MNKNMSQVDINLNIDGKILNKIFKTWNRLNLTFEFMCYSLT